MQWFMKDVATHLDFSTTLLIHVISGRHPECRQIWPLNSLDINARDFLLWGFMKEKTIPKEAGLTDTAQGHGHPNVSGDYRGCAIE
jgi:hypothetical protein